MAVYNEILAGRISRGLQKFFSMKGSVPAKQLAGDVMPVIQIFAGNDWKYLEGWNLFGIAASPGAVAAQFAGVRLRNPAGSGVIALVNKAAAASATADQPILQVGATTIDNGTILTGARIDARIGTQAPSLVLSSGSQAAPTIGGTNKSQAFILANTTYDFIVDPAQSVVVLPGDAVQVISNVVNQAITCSFMWWERPIEDSEKF